MRDPVAGWAAIWRKINPRSPSQAGKVVQEAIRLNCLPECLAGLVRSTK